MKTPSLYQRTAQTIRVRYIDGRPVGFRLPTQKELQDLLNVSSITIRNALRDLENRGYIQQRQGSGTFVLHPMENPRHVALLLEAELSSKRLSPYYLKILQEVRLALLKLGISSRPYLGHLRLGLEIGELTCREIIEDLRLDRISGVISLLARRHPSWVSEVRKRSLPLVGSKQSGDYAIDVDFAKIARQLLEYFIRRGRSRLGFINWHFNDDPNVEMSRFLGALAPEYGFSAHKFLIRFDAPEVESSREWASFLNFLRDPATRPDCLVIADDALFHKVQAALIELKLPLQRELDVAVVASDAAELSIEIPVSQSLFAVQTKARIFAETMKEALEGNDIPSFIEVPTTFIPAEEERPLAISSAPLNEAQGELPPAPRPTPASF